MTSDQSFIIESCHNSRNNHDIDIRPVTKPYKQNTATSQKMMMMSFQ